MYRLSEGIAPGQVGASEIPQTLIPGSNRESDKQRSSSFFPNISIR
jgi:hypothetical protein